MNAFTPYIANEHIAQLMLEADRARVARQVAAGPSLATRARMAIRLAAARFVQRSEPALA